MNLITRRLVCNSGEVFCSMSRISDQLHIISNQLQMKVWFYKVWMAARSHVYHRILSIAHTCRMIERHPVRPRDAGHKCFHKARFINVPVTLMLFLYISHSASSKGWRIYGSVLHPHHLFCFILPCCQPQRLTQHGY